MPQIDTFAGEIRVASRIVDYLSSGLYESPAACLKELINNSFDADARSVEVFVKPDADRIIIKDDGVGMSREEFEHHFQRISESHKRVRSDRTKLDRPKIGMIGIGAIAANELCDEMEIFSTKSGSTALLHVKIQFEKMRLPLAVRQRGGDVAKADYLGEIRRTESSSHFTHIFLNKVRGEARTILSSAQPHLAVRSVRSLYGRRTESVRRILTDPALNSWSEFDSYSKTMLQVALSVPVRYFDDWIPNEMRATVNDLEVTLERLRFIVRYDGTELRQPIVFPASKRHLIRRFHYSGDHGAATGYFYASHGTMKPRELQGLLIRIRNAAVGGYDSSFLDFPRESGSLVQRWVSAEVWTDDRLEEAMNIDRRTLRTAHPAYAELQHEVHLALASFLKEVRKELYAAGSEERGRVRATKEADVLSTLIRREAPRIGKSSAERLARSIQERVLDEGAQRRLTQRFTVSDLFRLVLDVAHEVLDGEALEQFLKTLTRRLTG